jgi:two-component system, response regulator PdtaR
MTAIYPRLRVLVVENEPLLRAVSEQSLSELGHESVGWAKTADDAVRLAGLLIPDLVLMDVQLDGPRTGVEAAGEIADRFKIRSLFVSGAENPLSLAWAHAVKPLGFVRKPFKLTDLDRALRAAECALRKEPEPSAPPRPEDTGGRCLLFSRSIRSTSSYLPWSSRPYRSQ